MAALVFSGVQPRWIRPRYDANLHLAHPPSPEQVEQAWQEYPDAAGALIVSPTPVRHLRRHLRDRRPVPPAGQAADRR